MFKFLFLIPSFFFCLNSMAEEKSSELSSKVVYGTDDRLDWYQVKDSFWLNKAESTAALVLFSNIESGTGNESILKGTNLGTSLNLCSTEPFREQSTVAFCSGFLVAKNIMITAGHCISNQDQCKNTKFVFGFAVKQKDLQSLRIPNDDIYSCKTILRTEQNNKGADFAVIQLDRDVLDRAPLPLNKEATLAVQDSLTVIGHPIGIPSKISGGAQVRSLASSFFVANLDTYGGNSGSAVFNSKTGLVEGILVRGEVDFENSNGCRISKVCSNTACRGEDVTSIQAILSFLP
jgi:V8-like Glu-specific endopeptidase